MTVRLVILNDIERPEVRMIALVESTLRAHRWTYISTSKRLSRYADWNTVERRKDHTPIEAFGVRPFIRHDGTALILGVERARPSRATYPDGAPRDWQGHLPETTIIRPHLSAFIQQVIRERAA